MLGNFRKNALVPTLVRVVRRTFDIVLARSMVVVLGSSSLIGVILRRGMKRRAREDTSCGQRDKLRVSTPINFQIKANTNIMVIPIPMGGPLGGVGGPVASWRPSENDNRRLTHIRYAMIIFWVVLVTRIGFETILHPFKHFVLAVFKSWIGIFVGLNAAFILRDDACCFKKCPS